MIKLVEDRVAVVPLENPDKIGSLWVPEIAKNRLNQGFVKYVGPDVQDCYVGMYVLFSGYTGTLVHVKNEGKLIIMPENFIIAELLMGDEELKEIPGLYFRTTRDMGKVTDELIKIMKDVLPGLDEQQYFDMAFYLGRKGVTGPENLPFFTANYELTMEYIAKAYAEDEQFRNRIRIIKDRRPTMDDIELSADKRRRPEGVPTI